MLKESGQDGACTHNPYGFSEYIPFGEQKFIERWEVTATKAQFIDAVEEELKNHFSFSDFEGLVRCDAALIAANAFQRLCRVQQHRPETVATAEWTGWSDCWSKPLFCEEHPRLTLLHLDESCHS